MAEEKIGLASYERWVHEIWADSEGNDEAEQLRALFIACVGAAGELGEVLEPIKKHIRKRRSVADLKIEFDSLEVQNEIGDVLYYLARIAYHCGFTLQDAINANVDKLAERYNAPRPVQKLEPLKAHCHPPGCNDYPECDHRFGFDHRR